MYAEERHVWQALLRAQPATSSRHAIERALAQACADELELENAIRARDGLPPLEPAELEQQPAATDQARGSAGASAQARAAGCLVLLVDAALALILVRLSLLRVLLLLRLPAWPATTDRHLNQPDG